MKPVSATMAPIRVKAPIVTGGQHNLYSLLTTYYLPPVAGYAAAGFVVATLVFLRLRARAAGWLVAVLVIAALVVVRLRARAQERAHLL